MLATFLVHTVLISKVLWALPLKKTWKILKSQLKNRSRLVIPYHPLSPLHCTIFTVPFTWVSESLEGKLKHNVVRKALIGRKKNRSLWRVIISRCTNIIFYEISKNIFSHHAFIQSFVIFKDTAVTQSETQPLFDVYFLQLLLYESSIYTLYSSLLFPYIPNTSSHFLPLSLSWTHPLSSDSCSLETHTHMHR